MSTATALGSGSESAIARSWAKTTLSDAEKTIFEQRNIGGGLKQLVNFTPEN
jgi:hypothetical protein